MTDDSISTLLEVFLSHEEGGDNMTIMDFINVLCLCIACIDFGLSLHSHFGKRRDDLGVPALA